MPDYPWGNLAPGRYEWKVARKIRKIERRKEAIEKRGREQIVALDEQLAELNASKDQVRKWRDNRKISNPRKLSKAIEQEILRQGIDASAITENDISAIFKTARASLVP